MDDEMDVLLGEIPRGLLLINNHEDWEQSYPNGNNSGNLFYDLDHLVGAAVCFDGWSSSPSSSSSSTSTSCSPSSSSSSGGTSPTADGSPREDSFLCDRLRAMHVEDPYAFHKIWGSSPPPLDSLWSEPPPLLGKPTGYGNVGLDGGRLLFMDQRKMGVGGLGNLGSVPNVRGLLYSMDGNSNGNGSGNGIGNGNRLLLQWKQQCAAYGGYLDEGGRGGVRSGVGLGGCEDGYIIQGKGVEYYAARGAGATRSSRVGGAGVYAPVRGPRRYSSVQEVRGFIYLLAKDQQGCRFLQGKFGEGNAKDVELIFSEIVYHAAELMVNPFANYLMQKLFSVCTEEQRMQVIAVVTEEPYELVRISLNQYGTRAVQKLIETLQSPHQIAMVMSALHPGFLNLIKDPNGNHVIQRCLHCLRDEDIKFIFEAAAKHCVDIATHQHGCCVLQRCVARASGLYRTNLVMKISDNGLLLAQDKFGNYVVQFIMELKIPQATDKLLSQFVGNFVELSKNKFSSNVVEKCLKLWADCRSLIISELLSTPNFSDLLQHQYANYVIQAALTNAKGHLYQMLLREIEPHESVLATSPYCKRIFSRSLLRK